MGCRKVIALDGCFLKSPSTGELLTAIGRDGNNHIYPIAWAVVSVENKDNWTWFLELLSGDLDIELGVGVTVISDQHKVESCLSIQILYAVLYTYMLPGLNCLFYVCAGLN